MDGHYPPPEEFIPHRSPMLLLRAVLSHEPQETTCEGWLDPAFADFSGGEVSAAFALELIAQTAAVHHGLVQRATPGGHIAAARGLLLGSRRLQLHTRALPVGEPLRVTVHDNGQGTPTGGMIRFQGTVTDARGGVLAAGDVTVLEWRPDP